MTVYAGSGTDEPEFIKGGAPIEETAAYTPAAYTPPPIIPITEEAPERNPLTPDGTGTVVDNITNENGIVLKFTPARTRINKGF